MNHSLTKEQSIDYLKDLWNEVYNEDSDGYNYAIALDMAIEALSAEPANNWIPVSERLPEVTDTVLVQDVCGDIETAEVCMDYDESLVFYGEWEYKLEELVAWMPLPTPYKGGDDE